MATTILYLIISGITASFIGGSVLVEGGVSLKGLRR
jgi:hypothetical protein